MLYRRAAYLPKVRKNCGVQVCDLWNISWFSFADSLPWVSHAVIWLILDHQTSDRNLIIGQIRA